MNFLILTTVLILCLALLLSRYFFPTRVRPFARLMESLPADHSLCAVDQCVKEYGHIWFFWSLIRVEDQLRLTVSLNVPHPDAEEDLAGLDADIRAQIADLQQTTALARSEWREMEGPLAMRLYLEFDWSEISAAMILEFQERTLEIIRSRHADSVVRYFRGSGDYDIYYSEQVGNVIERSLDMVNAFDIRKYSFKSEGMLEYNQKNEIAATAEEFEELYAAAKDDIEVTGLTLQDLRGHFRDLCRDEVILTTPVLYKRGRKDYLEAWYRDKQGNPCNWNIEQSDGAWWVYNFEGNDLGDIYEMDTEEEACDLFVRYVAEGIQNAEPDDEQE